MNNTPHPTADETPDDTRRMLAGITRPAGMTAHPSDRYLACEPAGDTPGQWAEPRRLFAAVSVHSSKKAARAAIASIDGGVIAELAYPTGAGSLIAELTDWRNGVDYVVRDSCDGDFEELGDRIEDVACDRCGAYNDDGEGYDGLCGNCADKAYVNNEWGDFDDDAAEEAENDS